MLTKVTKLEKLGGFRLRVHFSDGSAGVHDFTALVQEPGPVLEPLRDAAYFNRVFLEFGAPTWPNGYDMAPEWLRREMEAAGELTKVAAGQAEHGLAKTSRLADGMTRSLLALERYVSRLKASGRLAAIGEKKATARRAIRFG